MGEGFLRGGNEAGTTLSDASLIFMFLVEPFVHRGTGSGPGQTAAGGESGLKVVELEGWGRGQGAASLPKRRKPFQVGIVGREFRIVVLKDPDGGPLYAEGADDEGL